MIRIAGKYELKKVLGEGGFGKVYLAEHVDLKVLYALKLIQLNKAMEENFMERFKREAQILTSLLHKNSIPLRDFGKTEQGYFYMAMDYCPGQSLKDILNGRDAIPPGKVLEIIIQVLDVLEEAHNLGIVHRNLKPDNIMIQKDRDGKKDLVKVLDFGIAKITRNLDQEGLSSVTLTKSDAIVGSPMYMSPEQATNEGVDGQSDIYALGMVMYQMLMGRSPFESKTDVQTLVLQMHHYPDPFCEIRPDLQIPPAIEQTVFKAIHKEKSQRFANPSDFKQACIHLFQNLPNLPMNLSSSGPSKAPSSTGKTRVASKVNLSATQMNSAPSSGSSTGGSKVSTQARMKALNRKSGVSPLRKSTILAAKGEGPSASTKSVLPLILGGLALVLVVVPSTKTGFSSVMTRATFTEWIFGPARFSGKSEPEVAFSLLRLLPKIW